jgi:hypothetical protein
MRINPSYKKIELPTAEWPLLDDYVPPTNDECRQQNPTPYFTQLAAPVTSLRRIAEAILDGWPNVQTKCERATATDPWKVGRADRQGVGSRFMLGVVSMGDARRLGLDEARLETRHGFVGPTDAAVVRAVRLADPSESGQEPFTLDMARLVKADAYPGTMVVYTAARTANLPEADAEKVAQFIEVATTEGQRQGYGNGELPPGFVPIEKSGATAPLWRQAQRVAAAVAAQDGVVEGEPTDGSAGEEVEAPTSGPGSAPSGQQGGSSSLAGEAEEIAGGTAPADKGDKDKRDKVEEKDPDAEAAPVTMPDTVAVSSPLASRVLPSLLAAALLGAVLAVSLRLVLLRRRRG